MENFQLFHITCKGLIFHKNRFLLHRADDKDFYGSLECPGGRVNKGEAIEDVLERELKEEIGLELKKINHKKEIFALNQRDEKEYDWDPNTQIVEVYYKIVIPDNVILNIQNLEEVANLEWIDKKTKLDNYPYRVESRKDIYKRAQESL
jgi:8-oxo-dGTP pyrophosphatase MutT (NUDIX family)